MKQLRKALEGIPRIVRVLIDLLLAAVLLLGCYIARGSPAFGEEAAFRRAEKAGMVGPSVLLDRMFLRSDWPNANYNLLLIGDDGDAILFFTMLTGKNRSSSMRDVLIRREKTDGILLTTLPSDSVPYAHQRPTSVPLLLFVLANWCLTTLFDGEGSFKDVFVAASYCLTPIPILVIPATIVSNFVTSSEAGLITLFTTIAFVWMGLLLFCATMITHDYSMGKNLITFIGTIVGMAFIMFVAVLFSTLVAKLVSLITNIVVELRFRM